MFRFNPENNPENSSNKSQENSISNSEKDSFGSKKKTKEKETEKLEKITPYAVAVFDPRPIGKETNEKIFAKGPVYGIEVTIPALAERCIFNLDPQHSGKDITKTAIEAALTIELPPENATLATVRSDLDSIGAMAVLILRANKEKLEPAMERINMIATADKFAHGSWPGRRPLPTRNNPWPNWPNEKNTSTKSFRPLAAIAAAISDFHLPIEKRLKLIKQWLITGQEPIEYREQVEKERMKLITALENGDIKISESAGGKIAVVESTYRAATNLGYSLAPVVVALNPEFHFQGGKQIRKFTICQFEPGYADMKAILADLSSIEPGWGGSPTIGGSPQGISSNLTTKQVVEIVKQYLLR